MSNFLFVVSISVYPYQLVLAYKVSSGKCIDIDISKEFHGESFN